MVLANFHFIRQVMLPVSPGLRDHLCTHSPLMTPEPISRHSWNLTETSCHEHLAANVAK